MRRFLAAMLTAVLLAAVCLTLTGCDSPKIRVESVMKLTDEFKGSRTVTVVYPLNADVDAVKEDILADSPLSENVEGVDFAYLGATENGYSFELKIGFNNLSEYEERVGAVIGHDANAVLARKDTVMFKGTRMSEDFDVKELIGWIVRDTASNETTKDYTFEYPYNKVEIGTDSFDTGTTVAISEGSGVPVNSVDIKTYNEKTSLFGRTFDRSFVFAIPSDAYSEKKRNINEYFEAQTESGALITDSHEGNSILYTITFEGLSLSELETTTAAVLDSDGVSVYYGDKGNMSNPLFEGRVLEETLDTLSFANTDNAPPSLRYTYSLPTNAVRGEGALYKGGSWENTGTWEDGAFRLEDPSGVTHLRIFDGRQYTINGVKFELTSLGENRFKRVTSFLYPPENGFEGPVYATKFFQSKNAETSSDSDGEHIVCSVICEGSIDEINASLGEIFGNGNYVAYECRSGALSDKTTYLDYIDLREMLSIENAAVDMTYIASAENGENIVTLLNGGAETAYSGKNESAIDIKGCVAAVGYHGVIPKAGNIIFYIIFGVVLFAATTLIAYRMLVPPIRRERAESRRELTVLPNEAEELPAVPAEEDISSSAPTQTTTFSIFELGILKRNKKYVDEINQDVEERMNADRLERRKKELRQKELEEMEKKVYGKEEQSEPQVQPTLQVQDDTPRTKELLDAFDEAMKTETPAPEPTDPMELLDLMNGEDEDDEADRL